MLPKLEETLGVMYRVEESTLKGTMPNSTEVCEKMIYLNCSESLWTDLVILVKLSRKVSCYLLNKYAEYGGANKQLCVSLWIYNA